MHSLIENIHRSPHSVSAEELSGEIGHHGHLRFREQIGCGAVIMSCGQVRPENVPRMGTLRQGKVEALLETLFAVKHVNIAPAWADDWCSDPFSEIAIHKIFLGNLLCGAVRTELRRHVIGKLFSTFYTVDLDTSMSANRFTTELFRTKEGLNHIILIISRIFSLLWSYISVHWTRINWCNNLILRTHVGNSNGFAHAKFHLNPYIIQEITRL